jgi:hypothetical protein
LPASAFTGQAFHRMAQQVTERELELAQIALAKATVERFTLSTDVLAFDTTNIRRPTSQQPRLESGRGAATSRTSAAICGSSG